MDSSLPGQSPLPWAHLLQALLTTMADCRQVSLSILPAAAFIFNIILTTTCLSSTPSSTEGETETLAGGLTCSLAEAKGLSYGSDKWS